MTNADLVALLERVLAHHIEAATRLPLCPNPASEAPDDQITQRLGGEDD